MLNPLITVIISCYNHESYVASLIKSIAEQNYGFENIQLLVTDDNSTDSSPKVLKELKTRYDFDLQLNDSNKGICANINQMLSKAQGEYICITGSDDFWLHNKLDKQVAYMEKNQDCAVLSGNILKIDGYGRLLTNDKQKKSPARKYNFREIFLRDFPFSTTMAMIRKSALDAVGLYDESKKIEDYYMWLKLAHAGFELHFMEELLGYYRIHNTNSIHKSEMIYNEMRKIIDHYKNHPDYPKALKRLNLVYFPQLAKVKKRKALQLLPDAISNSRFFFRGLYHLFYPFSK